MPKKPLKNHIMGGSRIGVADMALHFIGFRDDRFWSAVKVFGPPDFIHRRWDVRAWQEVVDGDTAVFAAGTRDDTPAHPSFNDSEHC